MYIQITNIQLAFLKWVKFKYQDIFTPYELAQLENGISQKLYHSDGVRRILFNRLLCKYKTEYLKQLKAT